MCDFIQIRPDVVEPDEFGGHGGEEHPLAETPSRTHRRHIAQK